MLKDSTENYTLLNIAAQDPIEQLHLSFITWSLNVSKLTPNAPMLRYGDLGRYGKTSACYRHDQADIYLLYAPQKYVGRTSEYHCWIISKDFTCHSIIIFLDLDPKQPCISCSNYTNGSPTRSNDEVYRTLEQ